VRDGLDVLFAGAERSGAGVWLASGGFDFYIEGILAERIGRFERAFYNRAGFLDGGIKVEFPHDAVACERCAICKGRVCDLARAGGARVVFVGDGYSDRCAIGRADLMCAVRGSTLARRCDERGVQYLGFERFDELLDLL
jgi:2-hydroxy-3-keto-5-methylthiopentenyl-1-phosphate phosphatase